MGVCGFTGTDLSPCVCLNIYSACTNKSRTQITHLYRYTNDGLSSFTSRFLEYTWSYNMSMYIMQHDCKVCVRGSFLWASEVISYEHMPIILSGVSNWLNNLIFGLKEIVKFV